MYETIANSAEVIAGVLGIAVTVVAIIVELAANRYNHRITTFFIRDPVNGAVLGFFVLTAVTCLWTSALSGPEGDPRLHAVVLGMVSAALAGLLPYFYYVFHFISPLTVIRRIQGRALRAVDRAARRHSPERRRQVALTIDEIQDVVRSVVAQGDRDIALACVDALEVLVTHYRARRDALPPEWFRVDEDIRRDPDFVSLEAPAVEEIARERQWLEYKVFKQYQSTLVLCVGSMRELANLIGICTRRIAVEWGRDDGALLELCTRAMNSYLRSAINANEPRTSYYLLSQYRMIAERLLAWDRVDVVRAVARWFRTYGELARNMGQPFLQEVCAYDLVQLLEVAAERSPGSTDELLGALLDLDRAATTEAQARSLLGVRRAQLQAAALLLHRGDTPRAERVIADLRGEAYERIEALVRALRAEDRDQYWELTPRGVNFFYLPPHLRPYLDGILARLR